MGQLDSTNTRKKEYQAYTNEFMVSAGYHFSSKRFIDLGLRYYRWRSDGQTAMAFSGPIVGCEISMFEKDTIYIPYVGWQGQNTFIGYGLRAEYGFDRVNRFFGISPEIGLSLIELLRITAGYRFVIDENEPLQLSGFRFSVIAALPLSFLKKNK